MNTRSNKSTIRGLLIILALVALLFAGMRVTSVAARAAIPGDALYPVKTTLEKTRLSLASDAGERAQMKMTFAEQRLNEIASLIAEGRYREIGAAVLSFEASINGAILELETLAQADPARSALLAREITSALTRYAQTLSSLAASAPADVRSEVNRALTSTNTASSLDLPDGSQDDNSNANNNSNDNANVNGDDHGNSNEAGDDNSNTNGDDDLNTNTNDDGAANTNGDDSSNTNSADDNSNDDDSANANTNSAGDDNSNGNTNDDSSNDNDDNRGNNNDDDSGNDNGDDKGGNSGKGGG